MKILVVGGSGMLGSNVVAELATRGHEVIAPSSSNLDITNPESVAAATSYKADWCINCAAYTAVDAAESHEQEAAELNALGPGYLARAMALSGTKFLHISTDFVFDGTKEGAYEETDVPNPKSVYGRTKLAGEEAVQSAHANAVIFRTAWLYGPNGKSFPKTVIGAWMAGKSLRVIDDQLGCPTYTKDLAKSICDSVEANIFPGIYHATGPDAMTWRGFATMAVQAFKDVHVLPSSVEIEPIATADWPTPAQRPANSVLSNEKLRQAGITPMRPASEALLDFVSNLSFDEV